ncbi:Topoisomerase IV subunit A [Vibrio chagasii]|nr:Topoisomerase IV subunit A [Vibrio chagasii]
MNQNEFKKFTEELYLAYAMQTLMGRALPCVQDGLKPVHRRILFAMKKLGINSTMEYKKSARIVGDVIGQYHPHGDSSVYEAMVNQAQPWKSRYPLVDGQGNFGSRDGDSAAAMRYTESRTTPLADLILEEVNLGAVDFVDNFDGSTQEPKFLPAPVPLSLINGSEGIAVGMASNVPSHNAQEVCDAILHFLKDTNCTTVDLMSFVKGPDLASGGQIVTTDKEILKCYETGKGNMRVRARWKTLEKARGQYEIEIFELPFNISCKKLLVMSSDAETYEIPKKEKGKKAVKVDQKQLDRKAYIRNFLTPVDSIVDHTTSKEAEVGRVKLIVSPKSCKQTPEQFMETFIAMFDLESTMKFDLAMLSIDGRPETRSLLDIIADWVEFRRRTIVKRSESRLERLLRRLEIVDGRLSIMGSIDRVIEIIREADEPKEVLISEFGLTERQAEDVMEIRLRELRKLEEDKLSEEKNKLVVEIEGLEALLASKVKQRNLIGRELKAATAKLDNERRTLIEQADAISVELVMDKPKDPVTVYFTKDGWFTARKGHGIEESPDGMLKPNDKFIEAIETNQDKDMIVFTTGGRSFTVSVDAIPTGRKDIHINTLISANGDSALKLFEYKEGARYMLSHNYGYGFIVEAESLYSKQMAGKDVFVLKKFPDAVINMVEEITDEECEFSLFTSNARHMRFPISDVLSYPKSQGIKLARLKAGEVVELADLVKKESSVEWQGIEQDYVDFIKARSATPRNIQVKVKKVVKPEDFKLG